METATPLPAVPPPPNCNPTPRTIQIEFPQHSSLLLEALNRHRLEGKFCDVSLLVQGRELRAHKAVLAAASPYFHDKLLLGDAPRLTLPSVIEADAFEGLLQLIYSGRLRLPLDALPAHLLVASGLQMWQIQVEEEEEEEEEEEDYDDEDQASATISQTPQRARVSGVPHTRGSRSLPKTATSRRLPEDGSAPPLDPPAATSALPSKIFYVKQEPFEPKEEISGGGTQSGGVKEESTAFPGGDTEGNGELGLLPPSGAGATSGGGGGGGGGGPSWKPVDLHGNEILSGGGGPGGAGQAVHGPVKLGGTPPADGKCFGCLCGKRFAVKPKRDRHIMLTFSLRPFGCGICNKRFKLKHHLTEHMKTHAGALHACPHCGRRFRVHACFLRHQDLCKGQGWATAHWTYK
ncbi:zinc finger and BTB domain-containing protein 9 isoform X2 [Saccopteryx leptura]|uniref:zinc finger and BTB domain-containing protein 9 isoform X2 n=1 Tax=Saccopteryx leptura TaxID=249018 RepID=UPI00339BB16C